MTWEKNSKIIADQNMRILKEYFTPAAQQGRLESLTYTTFGFMSYSGKSRQLTKTAFVYEPFGY